MPNISQLLQWSFVVCCIWGVFLTVQFILWNLKRCRQAARVNSTSVLPLVLRQLRLQLRCNVGWKVICVTILILSLPLAFFFLHSPGSYAFMTVSILFLLFTLSEYAVPASVLLLGSSNLKCLCLFTRLDIEAFPYRTVLLLAPSEFDISALSAQSNLNFRYNNVRQLNADSWQDFVLSLAADVPVIVVDGSHRADAVDFEVSAISKSPALLAKTFVVSLHDGETPALDGLAPQQRVRFRCIPNRLPLAEPLTEAGLSEIISWRQKPHWEKMFYQIAYNAISAQAKMVARKQAPLDSAVNLYTQQHGYTSFYLELIVILEKFGRSKGEGLLGAIAGADADIELLSTFLNRWVPNPDIGHAGVVAHLTATLEALQRLKLVAETYPEIWNPKAAEYFPQFGFANHVPSANSCATQRE